MATMKTGRKLGDLLLSIDHSDGHLSVCYNVNEKGLTEYNIPLTSQIESDFVLGLVVNEFIKQVERRGL